MKYCGKCGAEINDDASFCPKCGAEVSKAEIAEDKISMEESLKEVANSAKEIKEKVSSKVKLDKKKILLIGAALIVVLVATLIISNAAAYPSKLSGTYGREDLNIKAYTFNKDGTFYYTDNGDRDHGTYIAENKRLTMNYDAEEHRASESLNYKVKHGDLYFSDDLSGYVVIFENNSKFTQTEKQYQEAEELFNSGKFEEAKAVFDSLKGYGFSKKYSGECVKKAFEKELDALEIELADVLCSDDGKKLKFVFDITNNTSSGIIRLDYTMDTIAEDGTRITLLPISSFNSFAKGKTEKLECTVDTNSLEEMASYYYYLVKSTRTLVTITNVQADLLGSFPCEIEKEIDISRITVPAFAEEYIDWVDNQTENVSETESDSQLPTEGIEVKETDESIEAAENETEEKADITAAVYGYYISADNDILVVENTAGEMKLDVYPANEYYDYSFHNSEPIFKGEAVRLHGGVTFEDGEYDALADFSFDGEDSITVAFYDGESYKFHKTNDIDGINEILANAAGEEYILPDSGKRLLTESDLSTLTKDELRIARNEIYARYGRKFSSADLQEHFGSCSWYNGTIDADKFSDDILSDIEKKNVKFIEDHENGTVSSSSSKIAFEEGVWSDSLSIITSILSTKGVSTDDVGSKDYEFDARQGIYNLYLYFNYPDGSEGSVEIDVGYTDNSVHLIQFKWGMY